MRKPHVSRISGLIVPLSTSSRRMARKLHRIAQTTNNLRKCERRGRMSIDRIASYPQANSHGRTLPNKGSSSRIAVIFA